MGFVAETVGDTGSAVCEMMKCYLVMRLITEGAANINPHLKVSLRDETRHCLGMMAVFSDEQAAIEFSENGRYPIQEGALEESEEVKQ